MSFTASPPAFRTEPRCPRSSDLRGWEDLAAAMSKPPRGPRSGPGSARRQRHRLHGSDHAAPTCRDDLSGSAALSGDVRSNLAYGLNGLDEQKMVGGLAAAGLDASFLDRDARALSVGQAQRACIARALVRDPEVLLMDEPTSSLDKDAAARIEALVGSLVAEGLSIVLVTHDLAQAKRVGSQALLLVDGRITATGSPADVEQEWPEEVA